MIKEIINSFISKNISFENFDLMEYGQINVQILENFLSKKYVHLSELTFKNIKFSGVRISTILLYSKISSKSSKISEQQLISKRSIEKISNLFKDNLDGNNFETSLIPKTKLK